MHIEEFAEIRRPLETVFDYLAHHPNHVNFIEQNVSCEQVSPGPMGVGTKVKNTANLFGKLGGRMEEHFVITDFARPTLIKKISEGGTFDTWDSFELSASPGGTQVKLTVNGGSKSPLKRVLVRLIEPSIKKALKKSLIKLKEILEASS